MIQNNDTKIYVYPGASDQETYDLENKMADPEKLIEKTMAKYHSFDHQIVLDIGAGGGYHTVKYAKVAKHVYAVEPSAGMLKQFHDKVSKSGMNNISILATHAEDIPLKSNLVDIVYSRFAYFFGPENEYIKSCKPGIEEAKRLLKPNGSFFVIDNNWNSGLFSSFLTMTNGVNGNEIQLRNEEFYKGLGFEHEIVKSMWKATDRESLKRVIDMEFGEFNTHTIMSMIDDCEIEYHYSIYIYQNK